jgi:hypothetical protein
MGAPPGTVVLSSVTDLASGTAVLCTSVQSNNRRLASAARQAQAATTGQSLLVTVSLGPSMSTGDQAAVLAAVAGADDVSATMLAIRTAVASSLGLNASDFVTAPGAAARLSSGVILAPALAASAGGAEAPQLGGIVGGAVVAALLVGAAVTYKLSYEQLRKRKRAAAGVDAAASYAAVAHVQVSSPLLVAGKGSDRMAGRSPTASAAKASKAATVEEELAEAEEAEAKKQQKTA